MEADRDQDGAEAHHPDAEGEASQRHEQGGSRQEQQVEHAIALVRGHGAQGEELVQGAAERAERAGRRPHEAGEREDAHGHRDHRQGGQDEQGATSGGREIPLGAEEAREAGSGGFGADRRAHQPGELLRMPATAERPGNNPSDRSSRIRTHTTGAARMRVLRGCGTAASGSS